MKDGFVYENGELIYYKDGEPYHAGVIQVDGAIYYISSKGKAIKGRHIVHRDMANGILKQGTYTFGEDYKLVKGSYVAPKKYKKHRKKQPRRSGRITMRDRIKQFFKKKKNITAALIVVSFAVLLTFLPKITQWDHLQIWSGTESVLPSNTSKVRIELPTFEEDVLLCSKAAKMEFDGKMELKNAVETGDPYSPFYFEYHLENNFGILYLSEEADISDAKEYMLSPEAEYVAIDNLKVDTTYYYEVKVGGQTYPGTFRTADSNRFVYIPGLVNTRDIGGYVNMDGKKVRQGLLIRGVELDGLVNAPYYIPEEEIANVQSTFGFVYDLDLRGASIYNGKYSSRLGVDHAFYDAPMYGGIFTDTYRQSLKNIFSDLADPEKYPMYLHCTWGTDRTGTIVFLLQGVLELSEDDMKREYRLTSYTNKGLAESTNMDVIISGLEPYAGDTLQEKIVTFLTEEIGVTQSEIDTIRSIFLTSET